MSRQKYYDSKSMCPFGYYIDEKYICIGSGEKCKLDMYPNKYDCLDYRQYEKKYKKGWHKLWHQ